MALALLMLGCSRGEAAAVRARLQALADEANKPPAEGLALVAHAASIGDYFTRDALVDLGPGSAPVQGRDTIVRMVARLQPRMAAFTTALDDVSVRVEEDGEHAAVALTLRTIPRHPAADDGADAREFALRLRNEGGTWRIAEAAAVQTLR